MKRTYRGLGSASAPVFVTVTAGQGKKGTQKDENREIFHISENGDVSWGRNRSAS